MKKWLILTAAILVAAFATASLIAIKTASQIIEEKKKNFLGLAIEAESFKINWLLAEIVFEKVFIYPAKKVRKGSHLVSADKIVFALSPLDIFDKEFHVRKIVLEKPETAYIRYSRKSRNWDALDTSELEDDEDEKKKKKGDEDGWRIKIDKVVIKDARIRYRNRVEGTRFDLNHANGEISNIISENNPKKLPSKIKLKGQIGKTKGKLKIKGRANLWAEGINFKVKANISKMPITYFAPFYAGSVPFQVRSGDIQASSKASSLKSDFVSYNHIILTNLRCGGMKGKMVNALVLKKGNRIALNATARGNLEEGNITISRATTQAITNTLMKQAVAETPMGKAGKKIKEGTKKVGDKIKGIFGR